MNSEQPILPGFTIGTLANAAAIDSLTQPSALPACSAASPVL